MTFNCEIQVDRQRVVDLFISACEGGSNYWFEKVQPLGYKSKDGYENMMEGFVVQDKEMAYYRKVSPKMIHDALNLMLNKHTKHFSDLITGNEDANTADVFLQLCVFGEVIYG